MVILGKSIFNRIKIISFLHSCCQSHSFTYLPRSLFIRFMIFSSIHIIYCVDHNKLWKILQEMGIPDHLICLLRNLYAGQEATVRTGHGTTDWFQIGKGVRQAVYCHPDYLTYMQSTSWETLGWKKHKLESRLLGEISITSDMQMTPPLWQKVKRNSKASWWKWKRRVKKLA